VCWRVRSATINCVNPFRRGGPTTAVGLVALLLALTSCAGRPAPAPAPAPSGPVPPAAAAMLAGWQLTLPIAGTDGGAAIVKPAGVAAPWLTADAAGHLVFFAPVSGVTTPNSEHARTELDRLDGFTAGSGGQTLSASLAVSQVPSAVPEVIVGQIHGAEDISSVPFVMLFYSAGALRAVVKQERSGDAHTDLPLLADVPLGTPFDYTITDDGSGTVSVTATAAGRTQTASAPVPAAFSGASVRFQAGAYQQAPSATAPAAADDGARVTFSALTVAAAAPPTS
jgi:Alginate lyase